MNIYKPNVFFIYFFICLIIVSVNLLITKYDYLDSKYVRSIFDQVCICLYFAVVVYIS